MNIPFELLDPVKNIMELIERLTKKSFKFVKKDNLEVNATVKIARQFMPEHIITYKPEKNEVINHLIAHECGHIKRLFETPPEKRFFAASNDEHKQRGMAVFENDLVKLSQKYGIDIIAKMRDLWFSGLVRQVTNQPIDLLIEKWLYEDYPSLRSIQILSLNSLNEFALKALDKIYRDLAPSFVYQTSILMNCAYANHLSRIVKVKFSREWKKSEFYEKSLALVKLLDIEKGWAAENDMDAVNHWVKWLGLEGWFKWHPFEDVPLQYYDIDH